MIGSPPPMRGKVYSPKPLSRYDGITPAYAGKRTGRSAGIHRKEDHPRLCGEKEADVQFLWHSLGSPPPMRGKDSQCSDCQPAARITPAYAGKSFSVHLNRHFPKGSPPPMRGKVYAVFAVLSPTGITPAYAGKSIVAYPNSNRT